jgi:hypothetical protein
MGKKDKLIKKLKSKPRDFTFEEAETLLNYLSFSRSNKGKTSKELLEYQVKQLCEKLEQEGLI